MIEVLQVCMICLQAGLASGRMTLSAWMALVCFQPVWTDGIWAHGNSI